MNLPPKTESANDNGKREDHLAAVVVALHDAIKGLDAPAELLVNARSNEAPKPSD